VIQKKAIEFNMVY